MNADIHDRLPPIVPANRRSPDLRSVSRRWLAAIVLVAGGGSALLGVAAARLCPPEAARPQTARWRVRAVPGAEPRGDQLAAAPARPVPTDRVRVEQLAGASGNMRPHTYVSFNFAPGRGDAPGPSVAALASPGPRDPRPALPPQILFGAAAPPPPTRSLAYAEGPTSPAEPGPFGVALNVSTAERRPPRPAGAHRVIAARPGDHLTDILQAVGLPPPAAAEAAAGLTDRPWFSTPALSGDERITLDFGGGDADGRPWRIALAAPGHPQRTAALADDGHYRPVLDAPAPATGGGEVGLRGDADEDRQTFRSAMAAAAESHALEPGLVEEAERLCGHDVDPEATVSARDRAAMVLDDDGERPRLASLRLDIGGHVLRYYRYDAPDDGSTDYYDPQGRSVTAFLLRKPVAAGRLGDGFGWRIHPVLGDRRFHQGVDYAAPFGSPIVAAGAGTIETIGREWGYGLYLRIRHDLGYETTYAHIAAVARGLVVGQRVRQGQTVAFVGSTGISTGPHLYYEVRINGHNVDPLTVRLAGGRVLSGSALLAFAAVRDRLDGLVRAAEPSVAAE